MSSAYTSVHNLATHMCHLPYNCHLHSQWARLRHTKVACHIHVSFAPALTETRRSGSLFFILFHRNVSPMTALGCCVFLRAFAFVTVLFGVLLCLCPFSHGLSTLVSCVAEPKSFTHGRSLSVLASSQFGSVLSSCRPLLVDWSPGEHRSFRTFAAPLPALLSWMCLHF